MTIETNGKINRRSFLQAALATTGSLLFQSLSPLSLFGENGTMPMRPLGATGLKVSLFGLGGFNVSLDNFSDQTASDFMRYAVDHGVNFFDNAREYNNGLAEMRMGKALRDGYREKVVLMTKNCGHERDGRGVMTSLEESLRALQTDYIDLMIFHEVCYPDDPERIFTRGGIEAAIEAKKQGKIRFIGFSGHKHPKIHLDMLSRPFNWDVVMLPLGIMDYHYHSFTRLVLPTLVSRNIGVIGFKTLGGFMSGTPQKAGVSIEDCLRYSMSLPASTIVVGMEMPEQLKQNVQTAKNFIPMTKTEMDALRGRTARFAEGGKLEIYKSTRTYDGVRGKKAHGIAE